MPTLKIALDGETYGRLTESALRELRPNAWHVVVLLRRSLGLPFPQVSQDDPAAQALAEPSR